MTITQRSPAAGAEAHHRAPSPGRSPAALTERRRKAVVRPASPPAFRSTSADADGGIIVDVDGNSFIDLGSGIAVTSVGASDPAVVAAVQEQCTHFTHTCFMVTPYEGYVAVAEQLDRAHPGRPREAHRAVQLGRRGGRERHQGGPPGHRPRRRRRLRPRLPRAHQPHHGAHRQGHALQDQLRPVRARGLPHAHVATPSATSRASRAPRPRTAPSWPSRSRSAAIRSRPSSSNPSRARAASSCPPRASFPR